jgi:uncharacterized protein YqgQ
MSFLWDGFVFGFINHLTDVEVMLIELTTLYFSFNKFQFK